MQTDFTETLATFFRQTDLELQTRIEGQEEALQDIRCTDLLVGRWIDSAFTSYLFAAFNLTDAEFTEMFPQLEISATHRQQVIAVMENHLSQCQRCSLKQGYDLEFEARFKKACKPNRDLLMSLLNEDEIAEDLAATEI